MIKQIINWLKRKSINLSEKKIRQCLDNIVSVSNEAYFNLQRTGLTDAADIKAVQKAKDRLIIQLCGPIPLEEVRQNFIEPVLNREDITKGAKIAINHAYEYAEKSIKR